MTFRPGHGKLDLRYTESVCTKVSTDAWIVYGPLWRLLDAGIVRYLRAWDLIYHDLFQILPVLDEQGEQMILVGLRQLSNSQRHLATLELVIQTVLNGFFLEPSLQHGPFHQAHYRPSWGRVARGALGGCGLGGWTTSEAYRPPMWCTRQIRLVHHIPN